MNEFLCVRPPGGTVMLPIRNIQTVIVNNSQRTISVRMADTGQIHVEAVPQTGDFAARAQAIQTKLCR